MANNQIRGRRAAGYLAVAGATALLATGGWALAASGGGVIHACANKKSGALRLARTCKKRHEHAISWNVEGPQGARGPQGPQGSQGAQGLQGPAAPSGTPALGYYAAKRAHTDLLAPINDLTIVSLESLPAGSYLLTGHATAADFTNSLGYVRCGIKGAGKSSMGSDGLGSATSVGTGTGVSRVGQIFVSLAVSSSAPFTAELFCRQTGGATAAYVEETRLMAIAVAALDVRGDQ
jgi:hypothetical protein